MDRYRRHSALQVHCSGLHRRLQDVFQDTLFFGGVETPKEEVLDTGVSLVLIWNLFEFNSLSDVLWTGYRKSGSFRKYFVFLHTLSQGLTSSGSSTLLIYVTLQDLAYDPPFSLQPPF